MALDLLYFVRPGERNEELRHSLRSVCAHLPHRRVWIVGHRPKWVSDDVGFIRGGNPHRTHRRWAKQRNVYANVRLGCSHDELTDEIIIMNDDFFVMHPQPPHIPPAYRCTLDEHIARLRPNTWWHDSLCHTRAFLHDQGITEPLSYELHRPIQVNRHQMVDALDRAAGVNPDNPPQWRTLWANLYNVGGTQDHDHKVSRLNTEPDTAKPWWSSDDAPFARGLIGRAVRATFREPCRYEATA